MAQTKSPPKLRNEYLSFSEILAGSLGIMGISGSIIIIVPLVFADAGKATWLAFTMAMLAFILVALQINVFARRIATPGSLYTFVQKGLGPVIGSIAGWSILIGYWAFTPINLVAVPYYLLSFIQSVSGHPNSPPSLSSVAGLSCVVALLAWWITYRDVKLSMRLILVIEFITVGLILFIVGRYFYGTGLSIDIDQFSLKGVGFGSFSLGLVLAMACFTGFEAASVFGIEAKQPLKVIPRANMATIILTGLIIIVASYALVDAFRNVTPGLDKADAPMIILANSLGIGWVAPFIPAGIAFSWFNCLLACLNTGGRLLYSLSRQGLFHGKAASIHARHGTPHIASALIMLSSLLFALVLLSKGIGVMDIINYVASFATFGFIAAYILVTVAALFYLHKHNRPSLKGLRIVSSVAALIILLIPLVGSVYPMPEWPMNILPFVFLGILGCAVGYFLYIRKTRPHRLALDD